MESKPTKVPTGSEEQEVHDFLSRAQAQGFFQEISWSCRGDQRDFRLVTSGTVVDVKITMMLWMSRLAPEDVPLILALDTGKKMLLLFNRLTNRHNWENFFRPMLVARMEGLL